MSPQAKEGYAVSTPYAGGAELNPKGVTALVTIRGSVLCTGNNNVGANWSLATVMVSRRGGGGYAQAGAIHRVGEATRHFYEYDTDGAGGAAFVRVVVSSPSSLNNTQKWYSVQYSAGCACTVFGEGLNSLGTTTASLINNWPLRNASWFGETPFLASDMMGTNSSRGQMNYLQALTPAGSWAVPSTSGNVYDIADNYPEYTRTAIAFNAFQFWTV